LALPEWVPGQAERRADEEPPFATSWLASVDRPAHQAKRGSVECHPGELQEADQSIDRKGESRLLGKLRRI
jgi:hypothetical protein